jgi:hypothetical protein
MWTEVLMQSNHPVEDILAANDVGDKGHVSGNLDVKIEDGLYGYPAKGLLFIESPSDIMRDLIGHDRSQLLIRLVDMIGTYINRKWPIVVDGRLITKIDKSFEATQQDWKNWDGIVQYLTLNSPNLVTLLNARPKGEELQKAVLPVIHKHKCNFILISGINECGCCLSIGRALASKLWTTFVTDNFHPVLRPRYAHEYEPPKLTAIVDPDLCGNEVFCGTRFRDPKAKGPDWVCFRGVGDQDYDDSNEKPLIDVNQVAAQLFKIREAAAPPKMKDDEKKDANDRWQVTGSIKIKSIT